MQYNEVKTVYKILVKCFIKNKFYKANMNKDVKSEDQSQKVKTFHVKHFDFGVGKQAVKNF